MEEAGRLAARARRRLESLGDATARAGLLSDRADADPAGAAARAVAQALRRVFDEAQGAAAAADRLLARALGPPPAVPGGFGFQVGGGGGSGGDDDSESAPADTPPPGGGGSGSPLWPPSESPLSFLRDDSDWPDHGY